VNKSTMMSYMDFLDEELMQKGIFDI